MVGAVVVTHGLLARELLDAAERIVGRTEGIRAVSMDWDDEVADARQEIESAVEEVDSGGGSLGPISARVTSNDDRRPRPRWAHRGNSRAGQAVTA